MPKNEKKDPLLGGDEEEVSTSKPVEAKKPKAEKPKEEKPAVTATAAPADKPNAATFLRDSVAQTKAILEKMEHVNFIIPLEPGEKPGAVETVQINGYGLTIKKNVMVSLPIAVANLIAEKYRINMEAGQDKRLDRNEKVQEALG